MSESQVFIKLLSHSKHLAAVWTVLVMHCIVDVKISLRRKSLTAVSASVRFLMHGVRVSFPMVFPGENLFTYGTFVFFYAVYIEVSFR